jgi:hypothetical protein
MKIAVDFDGTIVEHKYPEIGEELLFSIETLKELQRQQHLIILWTFRSGKELDEAVEYCSKRGLEFYAVNKNYPEEKFDDSISRKINADLYIDDRNLGGFPGWDVVFEMIQTGKPLEPYIPQSSTPSKKRSLGDRFRNIFNNE